MDQITTFDGTQGPERQSFQEKLRREGARINSLGTLVITQAQLTDFQNQSANRTEGHDISNPEPFELTANAKDWLSQPIKALLATTEHSRPFVSHCSTMLDRYGLSSPRNVLIAGTHGVADIPSLGSDSLSVIKQALDANTFGIRLKDRPAASDLILLCADLELVSLGAVSALFQKCYIQGISLGYFTTSISKILQQSAEDIADQSINDVNNQSYRPDEDVNSVARIYLSYAVTLKSFVKNFANSLTENAIFSDKPPQTARKTIINKYH